RRTRDRRREPPRCQAPSGQSSAATSRRLLLERSQRVAKRRHSFFRRGWEWPTWQSDVVSHQVDGGLESVHPVFRANEARNREQALLQLASLGLSALARPLEQPHAQIGQHARQRKNAARDAETHGLMKRGRRSAEYLKRTASARDVVGELQNVAARVF